MAPTTASTCPGSNLARLVADGEQVLVGIARLGGTSSAGPPGGPATPGTGPINLNGATADLLDTLPGVGPTLAGRILEWREQHGRFQFRRRAPWKSRASAQDPRRTRTPGDGVTSDAARASCRPRMVPISAWFRPRSPWAGVLVGVAAEDVVLAGIGGHSRGRAARPSSGSARHGRVAVFVALLCLVSGAAGGWMGRRRRSGRAG